MKIVSIVPALRPDPCPVIIDNLERLLTMAKNGEISSLVCAGLTHDGDRITAIGVDVGSVYELVGIVHSLSIELLGLNDE